MFYTYILWSESLSKYYVGSTADLVARLAYHNSGSVSFTRRGTPWLLIYSEAAATRAEAAKRERQIKSWKSAKAIDRLVGLEDRPGR